MTEEKGQEVVEPTPGEGAEPTPAKAPENVTSPEVKPEPAKAADVDVSKLQEQVNNLNIALKQEREAKKTDNEVVKKLEEKLANAQETIAKLGDVFNPKQPEEPDTPPAGLTVEQLEEFWDKKESEKARKQKEDAQAQSIRKEISELETTWDGKDGKPKYDDDEVIAWQKTNGKLHLTPKAAFYEMQHNEIVDYEVKQRLSKKPKVENVERPGGKPEGREPAESKPMSDLDIRAAVMEAMANAGAENNN